MRFVFGPPLPDLPTESGGMVIGNAVVNRLDAGWATPAMPVHGFAIFRSDDGGKSYSQITTLYDPDARS